MNFQHLMLPKLENLKPQPYNRQGSESLSPPIPERIATHCGSFPVIPPALAHRRATRGLASRPLPSAPAPGFLSFRSPVNAVLWFPCAG